MAEPVVQFDLFEREHRCLVKGCRNVACYTPTIVVRDPREGGDYEPLEFILYTTKLCESHRRSLPIESVVNAKLWVWICEQAEKVKGFTPLFRQARLVYDSKYGIRVGEVTWQKRR